MTKPYAITGASGRTGSATAKALLDRGLSVRVILRDPAKGDAWHDRGAEVAIADLADVDAMTAALSDTSGAYLVSPQQYGREDLFERAIVIAETVEEAVPLFVRHPSGYGPPSANGSTGIGDGNDPWPGHDLSPMIIATCLRLGRKC